MEKIDFSFVPIDRKEIPQSELNIEKKVRSNLFTWNGQFSPQFIEVLLSNYAKDGFLVIDPFLGSGTVLAECALKGLRAFGVELNASAYYMAKTYELANIGKRERQAIIGRVDSVLCTVDNNNCLSVISEAISSVEDSRTQNVLCALVVILDIYNNEIDKEYIESKWRWLKELIVNLPHSSMAIEAVRGDARRIKLNANAADLLITSPPYINVFNYHQKYRRSVEALGYNVLTIAKSEFGSNRKHRGNRLYTVVQYCIDMALSIKEACRVCKVNARMIYVVGRESSVLGYSFCNSELIYDIGTKVFGLSFLLRQERVFKNRFGQMIFEDVLHFSNSAAKEIGDDEVIEMARTIAVDMLRTKESEENKNRECLHDAIKNASKIKASEEAK